MNRLAVRFILTLATWVALALTLSACGLKGSLDPPPAATPAQVEAGPDGKPATPPAGPETPPPRKHFFLDWLLD